MSVHKRIALLLNLDTVLFSHASNRENPPRFDTLIMEELGLAVRELEAEDESRGEAEAEAQEDEWAEARISSTHDISGTQATGSQERGSRERRKRGSIWGGRAPSPGGTVWTNMTAARATECRPRRRVLPGATGGSGLCCAGLVTRQVEQALSGWSGQERGRGRVVCASK